MVVNPYDLLWRAYSSLPRGSGGFEQSDNGGEDLLARHPAPAEIALHTRRGSRQRRERKRSCGSNLFSSRF
jgi:hypothetical protein